MFMRHERVERVAGNPTIRIFAVGYKGSLDGGEVKTSKRHPELLWVDLDSFRPEDYSKRGWLKGVREYLEIRNASSRSSFRSYRISVMAGK